MTKPIFSKYEYAVGGELPLKKSESRFWLKENFDYPPPTASEVLAGWDINFPSLWLRYGRSALGTVMRIIFSENMPLLSVPDYQCASMFKKLGYITTELQTYPITENLTPLREKILHSARSSDAIMTCSYFGSATVDRALNDLSHEFRKLPNLPWVIEDRVTAMLYPQMAKDFFNRCDFCIMSLRKIYPVPDGAFLLACSERAMEVMEKYSTNLSQGYAGDCHDLARQKVEAKTTRGEWLHSGALIDNPLENGQHQCAHSERQINESASGADDDEQAGSGGSLRYLATRNLKKDLCSVRDCRKRITDLLTVAGDGVPHIMDTSGICVPILVKSRKSFLQHLAKLGVFLPVHWPEHNCIKMSPLASRWHNEEVSIPTLPTWTNRDMEHLCNNLKSTLLEIGNQIKQAI